MKAKLKLPTSWCTGCREYVEEEVAELDLNEYNYIWLCKKCCNEIIELIDNVLDVFGYE